MFRVLKYLLLILLVAAPVSAKYWNGSAWVDDTCNYYNGTAWVPCSEFYYDGAAWIPVNDGAPPVTYSLDLTITDSDGDDTVTVDGTAYTSSTIIIGLDSATETLTGGFGSTGTNDTVVCTGTAVSGTAPNYTIDMSDSNESATCTFSTASSICPTCSDGLVQAFVFDDGNADLTDWVGSNDVTINGATWAGSNDGLVFDGVDDYGTYTPSLIAWQPGATVIVLSTLENDTDKKVLKQYASGTTNSRIMIQTYNGTPSGRLNARLGRKYEANEVSFSVSTTDVAKKWRAVTYDHASTTATLWTETTNETSVDDVYEGTGITMDTGFLGADSPSAGFGNETIYRIYFYNRAITAAEMSAIVDDEWTPTHD